MRDLTLPHLRLLRLLAQTAATWLAFALPAAASAASLPAPRESVELASGWQFIRADAGLRSPTDGWEQVTVPHTWNRFDGQDRVTPGMKPRAEERTSDYFRGVCWYQRTLDIPASWRDRRVFLQFEAASQRANVYVNGKHLGEHRGSFTAFTFEITPCLDFGGPNELRVQLDNSLVKVISPLAGDFNVNGGLYRPVRLIATDRVCVSPLESGSPGVFVSVRELSETQATLEVRTLLSNGLGQGAAVEVQTEVREAAGRVAAAARSSATVGAGARSDALVQTLQLPQPHRWRGRPDPYLYSVVVQLRRDGKVVDEVVQPLGVRTVELTDRGFLLNGEPYPIYGVCRHQDLKDKAWALSAEDDAADVKLILDMGATAIRLAHYPQSERFHDLCDRAGLLVWNEVSFVNEVPDDKELPDKRSDTRRAFDAMLENEMREMILQRYNHPSAAWWGLFNELRPGDMNRSAMALVRRLNAIAHQLDASRPTVGATDKINNPTSSVPDSMGYNVYPGWYTGVGAMGELAAIIDERFAERLNEKITLSEYGVGGNPSQHVEGAPTKPRANGGAVHPEEWQTLMHERNWAQIRDNPKLWGTFIWVMFDFASDSRSEGGVPGLNDKGMVTHDRKTTKDAYHFYRANWSPEPFVYITSRRAVTRSQPTTEVKIYSTVGEVELTVNGQAIGRASPDAFHIVRFADVRLSPGQNRIVVQATKPNGPAVTDSCEWTLVEPTAAPAPAPGGS